MDDPQKKAVSGTYFVQDRQNQDELTRLTIQDHMLTTSMGGVLPEQADPSQFRRVLDVGCGIGGWILDAAEAYPQMSLFGVDISPAMLEYARKQAAAAGVADRVQFEVMDALLILEFPDNFFDLANMRLSASFLRTWEWPKILSELLRVTRHGGVIRVTESPAFTPSSSAALNQLFAMFQCALFRAGHIFTEEATGLIAHLPQLFTQHGCEQVQTKAYAFVYRADTPEGQANIANTTHFFRNLRPFIQKRGCASSDYDALYQQALADMQQPDFAMNWNLLTVWGIKP